MRRRRAISAAVITGAGAAVAGWAAKNPRSRDAVDLWALRFERPEGGRLALATLRGAPLLLNFWATWCTPCVTELPLLDRFFTDENFAVVGLAVDQGDAVRAFLRQRPVKFPVGVAGFEGAGLASKLGNSGGALPFSVVLDASSEVVGRKSGVWSAAELASVTARLKSGHHRQ